jgi:hypothetical protein
MTERDAARSAEVKAAQLEEEARRWRAGAEGERRVADALRCLPSDQWTVLHDLPIGDRGANVDHLVIGPGGVFTVNTKHVAGNVWVAERALLVAGNKTAYLPKATGEARRVSQLLEVALGKPVRVWPVIAFVDTSITVKSMPTDVTVIDATELVPWLLSCPPPLSHDEVRAIAIVADRVSTWSVAI